MKMFKRVALVVVALIAVVVLGFVGMMVSIFRGNAEMPPVGPIADGRAILIPDGYVAAFAVPVSDKHVALIDCGNDPEAKAVLAALSAQQFVVDGIFLTHGHPDHTNGCAAILKANPGAFLAASAAELPAMAGKVKFQGMLPKAMGAKDSGLTVTRALTGMNNGASGEDVVVGDSTVTAYAVAGHTAGSMMYLANGVLFFGDAATGAADGHIKAPPGPFSDDVDQGVASLHTLATTLQGKDVKTFAFAHSGPMPADLAKITAITP